MAVQKVRVESGGSRPWVRPWPFADILEAQKCERPAVAIFEPEAVVHRTLAWVTIFDEEVKCPLADPLSTPERGATVDGSLNGCDVLRISDKAINVIDTDPQIHLGRIAIPAQGRRRQVIRLAGDD